MCYAAFVPPTLVYHCQAVRRFGLLFLMQGLSPLCLFVMYVVLIVLQTKECVLTLGCVVHTKEGP